MILKRPWDLNQVMRGWANYFRHGVAKRVFGVLDSYAWRRIVTWIRRKHNRISWKELRRRFCTRGWRLGGRSDFERNPAVADAPAGGGVVGLSLRFVLR